METIEFVRRFLSMAPEDHDFKKALLRVEDTHALRTILLHVIEMQETPTLEKSADEPTLEQAREFKDNRGYSLKPV